MVDKDYLWARASLGDLDLRGCIVTRDMWDWQKGYHYAFEACWNDALRALQHARAAGLRRLPDPVRGSDRVLLRPRGGRIQDTQPQTTPGSELLVTCARRATPQQPLLVICGGPLTTVANALLAAPDIADRMVVFNLTVSRGGYNGKDAWSAWIVIQQTRYVDWGGGEFWDRDSVFRPGDFDTFPDNPMTREMKKFLQSDLGRANQLGDGAPLVWLFQPCCWTRAQPARARFVNDTVLFEPVPPAEPADLLIIPKDATNLRACREEFLTLFRRPDLFPAPQP
ncbi:MAG: hypothetical protein KatS3mg132_559 [Limisphaera sp.]|nr:MAG: hypothetical protein KatS3mg132_559 [Limisphaera sp.]